MTRITKRAWRSRGVHILVRPTTGARMAHLVAYAGTVTITIPKGVDRRRRNRLVRRWLALDLGGNTWRDVRVD